MTFIRKVKVGKSTYLAEVKSIRKGDKVKQKFIRYVGKEVNKEVVRHISTKDMRLENVKSYLDVMVIDKLMKELHVNDIETKHALAMVFSQLLERKSVNKLEDWFKRTEIAEILQIELSTKSLYHGLRDISDINFSEVEDTIYRSLTEMEPDTNAAVIDITDTYFEGNSSSAKRRRGKDGKVRKLIQIALAVTLKHGFPIFHNTYHGNTSGIPIYRDMILRLKNRNMGSVILDRGFLSKENLDITLKLSCKIIAGLRKSSKFGENYLSKIDRTKIYSLQNRVKLTNTSVHIQSFAYEKGKLIVVYNPSLEILKNELNFEKGINNEDKYTGYSLIYHNTSMPDAFVVKTYYEKDVVERAFKQLKGILNLRPIRTWLREHNIGHVRICYLAYAILSLMQYRLRKLNISAVDALSSLKYGYKINLKDAKTNFEWSLIVDLEPKQRDILKALKCSD